MIRLFELITGQTFTDKEIELVRFFIDCSTTAILNYTKLDNLDSRFDNIVVLYALYLYNRRDSINIQQYTEGGRSTTFYQQINNIPQDIISMLPHPKVRFL